ncbi:MAG: PAS domain-containing sensor histidine kinase [Calditrichaceae bacterium]
MVAILKDNSTEYMRFRIKVFEENINNPDVSMDLSFFFNEVIRGADYPIIYTDTEKTPQSWVNISPNIDSSTSISRQDSIFLLSELEKIASENDPLPIKYDGEILGYYYYGLSPVIYQLRLLPYMAIGSVFLFILLGYMGFSQIKKSEQRFIWVGMAKETAHQLGTPLSSLLGWIELIKSDTGLLPTALHEMQNDLSRLNKIANRFSKIGSLPKLKPVLLNGVIDNISSYFQKRLPNMQRTISINSSYDDNPTVLLNTDLFEWVLENLIKNALDAIEGNHGQIAISTHLNPKKKSVCIEVTDNGKGIPLKEQKNIFKPGFSTKQRGWGLGLSLARRIIEEYHGGKLILKESRPEHGTTFQILLKV